MPSLCKQEQPWSCVCSYTSSLCIIICVCLMYIEFSVVAKGVLTSSLTLHGLPLYLPEPHNTTETVGFWQNHQKCYYGRFKKLFRKRLNSQVIIRNVIK